MARMAVLAASLRRKEAEEIDRRYCEGYADVAGGDCNLENLAGEFDGWAAQGGLPSEVPVGIAEGLKRESAVNLDWVQTVECGRTAPPPRAHHPPRH